VKEGIMTKKPWLVAAFSSLLFGAAAQPALALSITIDTPSPGISGYVGPYADVVLTWMDPTTADVIVTTSTSPVGGFGFRIGGPGSIGLNVNGPVSVSGLPGSGNVTNGGAGNEGGFGSFNFTLDDVGGFQNSVTALSFVLTLTSGTWADENAVLTPNSSGSVAAADIFVANPNGGDTGATGYVNDSIPPVPDGGSTVALLGSALLGLGMLRRRFGKS
jgi:hypothetical protein